MFKTGDKVKFKKSSLDSGMIDATEDDVFAVKESYKRTVTLKELQGCYHVTHFEHYVEKEKVMERYIPNVGDKVKGFVFENGNEAGVWWDDEMEDYLEEIGEVVEINPDNFVIQFPDGLDWMYPLDLAHLAKIEESSQEILEESQIDWEVGQVVWDVRNGRGVVKEISDDEYYPIYVVFDLTDRYGDAVSDTYTPDGRYVETQKNRSLFFSEPKIEAEKFPPKKPFVAKLKRGDVILAKDYRGFRVITVSSEDEHFVYNENGTGFGKGGWEFRTLGEEIKFN